MSQRDRGQGGVRDKDGRQRTREEEGKSNGGGVGYLPQRDKGLILDTGEIDVAHRQMVV